MNKIIEKLKSIDKGTLIRTAALAATLLNDLAVVIVTIAGEGHPAYIIISFLASVAAALVAGWKNNDWTEAAQIGTKLMRFVKNGKYTADEAAKLIEDGPQEQPRKQGKAGRKDELK